MVELPHRNDSFKGLFVSSTFQPVRTPNSVCRILIVDSNPADVTLVKEAFRQAELTPELHVVSHGEEAFAFLRREGRFTNAPRPDFILLERHLPRISGMDVLSALKSDPDLGDIPVVVCAAFQNGEQVKEAYVRNADGVADKSVDWWQYFAVIRNLHRQWCEESPPPKTGNRPGGSAVGRDEGLSRFRD